MSEATARRMLPIRRSMNGAKPRIDVPLAKVEQPVVLDLRGEHPPPFAGATAGP